MFAWACRPSALGWLSTIHTKITSMRFSVLAVLSLFLSFASSVPVGIESNVTKALVKCAPIHMLIAHGSLELPGKGAIGRVASAIIRLSRQQITRESINYPAFLIPYSRSSSLGTAAVKRQLIEYMDRCPQSKIVMMGYSQGAHIIENTRTKSLPFYKWETLDTPPATHTIKELPEKWTVSKGANHFVSYCDSGDTFCDGGIDVLSHLVYVEKYGEEAVEWIVGKIGG
ncbi:Similar to Acetylxylan esterase 2; acc. no. O59893 [Pyronema omphalodes CBS 100304]|uniref:Similar to Acetylxylan esterase 2 acc. no. O59893 n=1 Tax=Pyronema omphalodes (strain CBS 100304) TaxID=1076935 RepID=U4L8C2_PYROM|nr:Similar to Acetylxylan esterase 2; acc. no. O59893 [Pyronema omphalodes CBS 100304]